MDLSNPKIKQFLAAGACALAAAGMVIAIGSQLNSSAKAEKILTQHHFTDIQIGSTNWWCARGTSIRRHFEATNDKGQRVEGSLCAGRVVLADAIETKPKLKP